MPGNFGSGWRWCTDQQRCLRAMAEPGPGPRLGEAALAVPMFDRFMKLQIGKLEKRIPTRTIRSE